MLFHTIRKPFEQFNTIDIRFPRQQTPKIYIARLFYLYRSLGGSDREIASCHALHAGVRAGMHAGTSVRCSSPVGISSEMYDPTFPFCLRARRPFRPSVRDHMLPSPCDQYLCCDFLEPWDSCLIIMIIWWFLLFLWFLWFLLTVIVMILVISFNSRIFGFNDSPCFLWYNCVNQCELEAKSMWHQNRLRWRLRLRGFLWFNDSYDFYDWIPWRNERALWNQYEIDVLNVNPETLRQQCGVHAKHMPNR